MVASTKLALVAGVRLLARVLSHVQAQICLARGLEATDLADVGLELGMDGLQAGCVRLGTNSKVETGSTSDLVQPGPPPIYDLNIHNTV